MADEFAPPASSAIAQHSPPVTHSMERLLTRADSEVRLLRLNFYRKPSAKRKQLLAQGSQAFPKGAFSDAVEIYQDGLALDPRNPEALHDLGSALTKLGPHGERRNMCA